MQIYQYKNKRGDEVGFVEDNIYKTERRLSRGQIFLRKRYFNGVLIDNAIAIDERILNDLLSKGIKIMEVTIIGIRQLSFKKYVSLEVIKRDGQTIKFDKRNLEGENITGFGEQVVFSYDWGFDRLQKTLI